MAKWTIERKLLVGTFVFTVLGFTFGLGVNWAMIVQHKKELDEVPRTYLRRDVYEADQRRLTEAINRLTITLERMEDSRR